MQSCFLRPHTLLLLCGVLLAFQMISPRPMSADEGDDLVVHEWGTFTTFSGSDGVFLDWRPLEGDSDLPDFVVTRIDSRPGARFAKSRVRGRVRMETPITYFYTDRVRRVKVAVDFPKGLLTEFYPPVRSMMPPVNETAL
ncbi:MAG: hypothetical protein AAFN70_12140, partial [Planctomycetota bacterium]